MTSIRTQPWQRRNSGAAIVAAVCPSGDLDGTPNQHEEKLLSNTGSPP